MITPFDYFFMAGPFVVGTAFYIGCFWWLPFQCWDLPKTKDKLYGVFTLHLLVLAALWFCIGMHKLIYLQ